MIQIRISKSARYSQIEMAQMAIEGGCGWLVLNIENESDIALFESEFVPMCREAGVILTLEDNLTAARELKAHGVFLHLGGNAVAAREDFGVEAIIGAEVASAASAVALAKADIDYVALPADIEISAAQQMIAASRDGGAEIAFVATCAAKQIDKDFVEKCREAGYAGYFVTEGVFDNESPTEYIKLLHSIVNQ